MGVKVRDETLAGRVRFSWPSADKHSEADLERMREAARVLRVQARAVGDMSESPFGLIAQSDWSPTWEARDAGLRHAPGRGGPTGDAACTTLCLAIELDCPTAGLRDSTRWVISPRP